VFRQAVFFVLRVILDWRESLPEISFTMNLAAQIAKHFNDVHFGGNWTVSNMKDNLADVTWQQATTQVHTFNTIATLVYHIGYFVSAATEVLQGKELNAKDEFSFSHPPINSKQDWENLVKKSFADAEHFSKLIENLPEDIFEKDFADKKYGSYYRNLLGIIEHTHCHLGQIAILKKMVHAQ